MYNGLVVYIDFLTTESEHRLRKWIDKGNKKIIVLGDGALGLQAHLIKTTGNKYIFCWEHSFFINFSLFLRFMFFLVNWNIRKEIRVSSISKVELVSWLKG